MQKNFERIFWIIFKNFQPKIFDFGQKRLIYKIVAKFKKRKEKNPNFFTKLMAYFDLNKNNPEANNIFYPDTCIYKHYTWANKKWDVDTFYIKLLGIYFVRNIFKHETLTDVSKAIIQGDRAYTM